VSRPVTLIRGDGIGPEITAALERGGMPLPEETIASIRRSGLALKGPLTTPVGEGFRSVNVALRQEFDLYANLRPARSIVPGGRFAGVDIVVIRENTEGMYVGLDHTFRVAGDRRVMAQAMSVMSRAGCERICRFAFEYAVRHGRKKVTVVHKANILRATSGLFLDTARRVAAEYDGRVEADDKIVDNAAMRLVLDPSRFDVIVTTNLFGDILSDLVSGLVGGLGLAPAANLGTDAAIFEAVHGSAPDIAGQGVANPAAQMLAAALLLDHVDAADAAARLRCAIESTIVQDNVRTRDLGGGASTAEFARAVARRT
jgi:isocitrate dehydrogenase (NAD+)